MSLLESTSRAGRGRVRQLAMLLFAATSALSILHYPFPAFAQVNQSEISGAFGSRNLNLRFTHLSLEEGLSQSVVYDVLQDRHGYMWFSTQEGLNRYDGFEVRVFNHIPFDSTSIKDTRLYSLLEDQDGNLWISGRGLIMRMDPIRQTFERFQMPGWRGTNDGRASVMTMTESRDGVIWAGGARGMGLIRFDRNDEQSFRFFEHDSTDESSAPAALVSTIFEDSRGTLWIKSAGYLSKMDEQRSGKFVHYEVDQPQFARWYATSIYERPEEEGILWVGTYDGLVRFDTDDGTLERFRPERQDAETHRVGSIVEDPTVRGVLWVGLDDGLARFDIQTQRFVSYRHDPANPSSLAPGFVTALEVDRQGLLWIGTWGSGIDRFNPSAVGFELVGSRPGGDGVFENHSVRPIYLTRDNVLVVGSGPPGTPERSLLTLYDRKNGRVSRYPLDRDDRSTVREAAAVFEDARGSIWIGGFGVARFDRETGRFEHFLHDPSDPSSAPEDAARFIEDRRGFIWVAGSVVARMDPDRPGHFDVVYEHDPDDLESILPGYYIDIDEDPSGYLWISSTTGGVGRLDPTTGKAAQYHHDPADSTSVASNRVWDVLVSEHEPGVVWASGSGLSRLDVDSGTFRNYSVKDGLPSLNVYGALEDERGRIWMSTNHGISRFDPQSETFRNYGMESGLQSLEFNGESLHKAHTGEMFFGGIKGLNAFFPNALIESSIPPEPRIVELRVGDMPIEDLEGFELETPIPDLEELTLEYENRDVTIDFNAFHFQSPRRNEFEYRLDGFHDDWISAGTRKSASYTNLAPGAYRFRLRAANSDGVWSDEEAALELVIRPPWWRTWLAYLLYAIILGVGIFAVDRVQRSRLLRKEREKARAKELEHAREIEQAYNELRTAQDRLIQSEKMASLGQLTAGIAHEIKNPLNFVNNFSDLSAELADELLEEIKVRRGEIPDDLAAEIEDILASLKLNVEKIHEHGKRADSIVYGMLQHSRTGASERVKTDINNLVDEHLNLAYHGMRAREPDFNSILETEYDEAVGSIEVLSQELGRVILNLIGNAFDALYELQAKGWESDEDPTLKVSTHRNEANVEIRIADNGPGIPDEVKSKIFEPFFTTKPTGSGTGLGLSMSYDIVTKGHEGQLEVISEPGEGATFVITLPVS